MELNIIDEIKRKSFHVVRHTLLPGFFMKIKDVKVLIIEGGPNPPEGCSEENPSIEGSWARN